MAVPTATKQRDAEGFRKVCASDAAPQQCGMATALDRELAGCRFEDARLGRRFRKLVGQLAHSMGESISLAC